MQERAPAKDWREIFLVFFKLGSTSFGGPAAHIAMMENELVQRRAWLSHAEFLDLIGAANLIPGPNSTEVAIHVGYRAGGWRGLLAAGTGFILPAFFIVLACAWAYVRYGSTPELASIFSGVVPAILAVVAIALWKLAGSAVKNVTLGILGAAGVALYAAGFNEIGILFSIALVNVLLRWPRSGALSALSPAIFLLLYFAKVGSVLFGSGYVLIAFLQGDLVDKYQLLSQKQLLDAIAVGQFTPGPVFTTATFVGYLVAGTQGALTATVGIFLPAFVFVALSAPFIPRLRASPWASHLLDGLNVASLSLMLGAAVQIAHSSLVSWFGVAAFLVSFALLARTKLNAAWIVAACGIAGYVLTYVN